MKKKMDIYICRFASFGRIVYRQSENVNGDLKQEPAWPYLDCGCGWCGPGGWGTRGCGEAAGGDAVDIPDGCLDWIIYNYWLWKYWFRISIIYCFCVFLVIVLILYNVIVIDYCMFVVYFVYNVVCVNIF